MEFGNGLFGLVVFGCFLVICGRLLVVCGRLLVFCDPLYSFVVVACFSNYVSKIVFWSGCNSFVTNCLSVSDHSVGLALKGLTSLNWLEMESYNLPLCNYESWPKCKRAYWPSILIYFSFSYDSVEIDCQDWRFWLAT